MLKAKLVYVILLVPQLVFGGGDLEEPLWETQYFLKMLQEKGKAVGANLKNQEIGSIIEELNKKIPDQRIDLSGALLCNVQFDNCTLKNVDFSRSNLAGANFKGACIEHCNFDESNIAGTSFENVSLYHVTFNKVQFKSYDEKSNQWVSNVNFGGLKEMHGLELTDPYFRYILQRSLYNY